MKRTNQTARAVMKLAHSIKAQFSSFSAALKAAWAQIKQPAKTLVERLIEMGGNRWTKSETLDRIYFNTDTILSLMGISYHCYSTGKVSSNSYGSNKQFNKLWSSISSSKNYYDIVADKFVGDYIDEVQAKI